MLCCSVSTCYCVFTLVVWYSNCCNPVNQPLIEPHIAELIAMGFGKNQVEAALLKAGGDVAVAANDLLGGNGGVEPDANVFTATAVFWTCGGCTFENGKGVKPDN